MPPQTISRRSLLGASGIAGASLLTGSALLTPAYAGSGKVRARLDRSIYRPGDRMVLRVTENLGPQRRIRVKDTTGLKWRRVSRTRNRQVWTAKAPQRASGRVTVTAVRSDGAAYRDRSYRDRVEYRVDNGVDHPAALVAGAAMIGMSSPAHLWAQRVAEVGPGLAARRIFADLAGGPHDQMSLVEAAHAEGLLPVISYKVGGDVAGAVAGRFNAVAEQAAARLASYGRPTAVTFWHEPHGDMAPADYVAASKQLLPIFKRGELRVGPFLNGWLLDRQQAQFGAYCPDELFDLWDWFGIDTYESGTLESPGPVKPADRIPAMSQYVSSRGFDLPLGVGEYNGYSAETIHAAGEALLTTPNVWFGCMWNSTIGKGYALSGERLAAFRATLADPRCASASSS